MLSTELMKKFVGEDNPLLASEKYWRSAMRIYYKIKVQKRTLKPKELRKMERLFVRGRYDPTCGCEECKLIKVYLSEVGISPAQPPAQ